MSFGFLGIQYSFGLQQSAVNPIYSFLGANPDDLPFLNLAGPMTGLIIQPIIGAMSDKTWSTRWGRRKPYFLVGAVMCSVALFFFPFSRTLWMAAGLLWILDAGNNTAMEPYRAFVADKLPKEQYPTGFMMQSFFTGLGITLANICLYFFEKKNLIPGKSGAGRSGPRSGGRSERESCRPFRQTRQDPWERWQNRHADFQPDRLPYTAKDQRRPQRYSAR